MHGFSALSPFLRFGFVGLVLIACCNSAFAVVVLDRLNPISGIPGSSASLYGAGFQGSVQVSLSGINAGVTFNNATQVNFTIPAGATSGFVAIGVSNVWYTNPIPFTVTRPVQGQFNPPAGLSRAGYRVVTGGKFETVNSGTGQFNGFAERNQLDVIWAFREADDPAFIAFVPPATNQPVIDATSTAEALVLLNPAINGRPLERYTNLVGQLRATSEFNQLASLISSISAAGKDYLDDARVEGAMKSAVEALIESPSPFALSRAKSTFDPGTPHGTKLRYLDPPEDAGDSAGWRRLKVELDGPDQLHPDGYGMAFSSAERFQPFENPLDWFVKIYELEPSQFTNGLVSVGLLKSNSIPLKRSGYTIGTASVSAGLFSKKLDFLDSFSSAILDSLFGHSVDLKVLKPNETIVPAKRPGVYVTEAYSGSIYYGTEVFADPPLSQSQLITDINGRVTWAVSLGGNVFVAAIDLISGIGGITELVKSARSTKKNDENESVYMKILQGVAEDVVKGLAVHENNMQSADTLYDLIKGAASSLIKNMADAALENAEAAGIDEYGTKILKTTGKIFNVLAKISSVAQGVERTTGLLNGRVLAVERSAIVVGNPFSPHITSFFPQKGRGGELLTIQGANFGSDTNELKVSFRQFANTEDPSDATSRLDLQILNATPSSIAVRVPWTNFAAAGFANLRAFIVVERGNSNFIGSTASLSPPFQEFRFLAPPTITSVIPNPVTPGSFLELRGLGFDNETAREYEVLIDGISQGLGRVADFGGGRMGFILSQNISVGMHNLSIRLRGNTNAPFPFSVQLPPYTTPSGQAAGYGIIVEKADLSNDPEDGKISVLEAFLIINGQRTPRQHDPCEFLPELDPEHCPFQERETDHVSGDEPGTILGPVDTIIFAGDLVFTGTFPALTDGDRFIFGSTGHPFTIDGASTEPVGLLLDGTSGAYIGGNLVVRNINGNGVHLRNGATGNFIENVTAQNCVGDGFLLEGNATGNQIRDASVTNAAGSGIRLTGGNVQRNVISSTKGGSFPVSPYTIIANCGNGIRIEGGANFNNIIPGTIRNCLGAGIYVGGASNNFFGRETDELARHYDIVNNQGPGAYIGPGAVGNVFRYLNPIGNQGDGVLLEGPGCSNNIVDRAYAGVNLYEGGTSPTIANQGSGIRIASGAQFNLIGSRLSTLGQHGSISGNRDDGIRIEGTNTSFNTVNSQNIGVLDPYAGVSALKFSGNGLSGIALRNGAHHNTIGDHLVDLANVIFASPQAGIEITGNGTADNLIYGNQIGTFFTIWVLSTDSPYLNQNGIWLHDGPEDNVVGLPGARLLVPRFPGDTFPIYSQYWNAINTSPNAGILIQNAGGTVGTDLILAGANVIQANHVGELDNGNLAPSGGGTGIKLEAGAQANIIGGPLPELGNRVRGWIRAGVWINQNNLQSVHLRNRFENNYIEGPGTGVLLRYPYLTETPVSGVGFLVTDSIGHAIGESLLTKNTLYVNRLGLYMGDSSSNVVRGFYITNSFDAGLTVRGGEGNAIGGDSPDEGNLIHAFGINNEASWAGLTLSQTIGNRVVGNEIGLTAPGRGAVGLFITNAANNVIGGPSRGDGNCVISNTTNGVLISGPSSAGNKFFNNSIGLDRDGALKPNRGDGIRIENDAHDNFIGGLADDVVNGVLVPNFIPSGNIIVSNGLAGVRVAGAGTVGNRILYNRITGNGGKGIQHENGGNTLQPPPIPLFDDGKVVSGNVASLTVTPSGSIIQLFRDPSTVDPEGDAYMGTGIVQSNGTWRVVLTGKLYYTNLTATATDGVDGSTSEFGTGANILIRFLVDRTDASPQESIPAGANNDSVFRLSFSAVNADVRVKSIGVDTGGSLFDPTNVLSAFLYEDKDGDGVVTGTDLLLGGPASFATDNGRLLFSNINAVIEGNTTQKWVVAYHLSSQAPVGSTFQLLLTNPAAVSAEYVNPVSLQAVPEGDFAIQSAQFTVGAAPQGQTYAAWAESVFTPAQLGNPLISGAEADPDGDGLNNLGEYAYGLNPLFADRDTFPSNDRGMPHAVLNAGFLDVTFVRRKPPVDLVYEISHGNTLSSFADALSPPAYLMLTSQTDVGAPGSLERVTYKSAQPLAGSPGHYIRVSVHQTP